MHGRVAERRGRGLQNLLRWFKSTRDLRCPGGGIGRRVGLKNQWQQCRAGSSPALGTFLVWGLLAMIGKERMS